MSVYEQTMQMPDAGTMPTDGTQQLPPDGMDPGASLPSQPTTETIKETEEMPPQLGNEPKPPTASDKPAPSAGPQTSTNNADAGAAKKNDAGFFDNIDSGKLIGLAALVYFLFRGR